MNACRYELDQITGGFYSKRPPRGYSTGYHSGSGNPAKLMRGAGGYRGSLYGDSGTRYSRGSYGGYRGGGNRGYGMSNSRGRGSGSWGGRGGFRGRY